jgi:hypothetical protein
MPVTINGTTGITTPAENTAALTVGSITGMLKATSGVVAQAVAGSDYGQLTLGTAQTAPFTAPNTYADFTGIPSWAKRITVMFNGVSTNGTSSVRIRVGTSGGPIVSGYSGTCYGTGGSTFSVLSFTAGFDINDGATPAANRNGLFILQLIDSNNNWVLSGNQSQGNTTAASFISGSVSAGGVLTQLRITTVNGTDTFDAGTINISYE